MGGPAHEGGGQSALLHHHADRHGAAGGGGPAAQHHGHGTAGGGGPYAGGAGHQGLWGAFAGGAVLRQAGDRGQRAAKLFPPQAQCGKRRHTADQIRGAAGAGG